MAKDSASEKPAKPRAYTIIELDDKGRDTYFLVLDEVRIPLKRLEYVVACSLVRDANEPAPTLQDLRDHHKLLCHMTGDYYPFSKDSYKNVLCGLRKKVAAAFLSGEWFIPLQRSGRYIGEIAPLRIASREENTAMEKPRSEKGCWVETTPDNHRHLFIDGVEVKKNGKPLTARLLAVFCTLLFGDWGTKIDGIWQPIAVDHKNNMFWEHLEKLTKQRIYPSAYLLATYASSLRKALEPTAYDVTEGAKGRRQHIPYRLTQRAPQQG